MHMLKCSGRGWANLKSKQGQNLRKQQRTQRREDAFLSQFKPKNGKASTQFSRLKNSKRTGDYAKTS